MMNSFCFLCKSTNNTQRRWPTRALEWSRRTGPIRFFAGWRKRRLNRAGFGFIMLVSLEYVCSYWHISFRLFVL